MDIVGSDELRARFSAALSAMYRVEVPQYGALLEIVTNVNAEVLAADPELQRRLHEVGELERVSEERHGAIRLGSAHELAMMRRLLAVMGMVAVGYYDLTPAGLPVQSTAFRPIQPDALRRSPFRVFTSLLRLELIEGPAVREEAASLIAERCIFSDALVECVERAEREGLAGAQADAFIDHALETFRWHREANVSMSTYRRLLDAHPLVADVAAFKGPHLNHLTPRTLDIDAAQLRMRERGLQTKTNIEGPPRRRVPILLRQTSFLALDEPIDFRDSSGGTDGGFHTARFGEIEQRGAALTLKGRALYDALLADGTDAAFEAFPDDEEALIASELIYASESIAPDGQRTHRPIVYEDFLPVSAAGIFRSNLRAGGPVATGRVSRAQFEADLGETIRDEFALYAAALRLNNASLHTCGARKNCRPAHGRTSSNNEKARRPVAVSSALRQRLQRSRRATDSLHTQSSPWSAPPMQ